MKARYSTLLVSALITAGMMMSLLFVARRIVLNNFLAIEDRHVTEDIERAVRHLDTELQNLDRTAKDYATWDDTFSFMHHQRPQYLHSNYTPVTFANLGLRTVLLMDVTGRVVYIASWRRDGKGNELNVDLGTIKQAVLFAKRSGSTGMSGILGLSDGPVLASMRPILTTNERGPSRGTLVMLRDLDYRLLGKVTSLSALPMGIYRVDRREVSVPPPIRTGIRSSGLRAVRTISDQQMTISTEVVDWFGHPSYELEIRHNREVWQQGLRAYRFLMYSILTFGGVFCGVLLLLVQLVYVNRAKVLTRFAERIKNEQELKSRITFRWKDELATLAEQINQMLEQLHNSNEKLALARERLQHDATHDSLTGTWNCAAALELLDRELARSERDESTVGVMMLDLDHFKAVNDRFGHAAGDRALQTITASIGRILRTSDILARYGGEEFLVIAPECGLAESRKLAERILLRTQATSIEVGEERIELTVSIGLVSGGYPLAAEELIALADRALYRAKEKGRNRVEYEEALPARVKGTLYCMPRRIL